MVPIFIFSDNPAPLWLQCLAIAGIVTVLVAAYWIWATDV